jgi:excisionase family DNA binding protein
MTSPARLHPDSMLVTLTVEQLRAIVREEVAAARPAEFVDSAEVARLLRVETSTVPTLVKRDGLPHHRIGRQYRFRVPEVVAWAEERAQRPGAHARKHMGVVRSIRGSW